MVGSTIPGNRLPVQAAQLMIIKGSGHYPNFDSTTVLPVAVPLLRNTIGG